MHVIGRSASGPECMCSRGLLIKPIDVGRRPSGHLLNSH